MAIANLHETIQSHIMRRNQLNLELTQLESQKSLAIYAQGDLQRLFSEEKGSVINYFKDLFENDEDLQCQYIDYTELPEYEYEMNIILARHEAQLAELTAWETAIDAQITTNSTELKEIEAFLESYKGMLSTNISEDFNYGLNG